MKYTALKPLERKPREHHPTQRDPIQQVLLGQFPLSINQVTGEFALDGSRLTVEQWIDLRSGVDSFLQSHGWLEILQVNVEETGRTMLSRLSAWLTRR